MSRKTARVHVLGSVNVDTVLSMAAFPSPGTTVIASGSRRALGGKGASQAVACVRFGAHTSLTASVGADADGELARSALASDGVDTTLVRRGLLPTGRAFVYVDELAENEIVVDSGANGELRDLTGADLTAIMEAEVLLAQLEAGVDIAVHAIEFAEAHGVAVVLNAAPAHPVPSEVLHKVDFLIVNEHEAVQLGAGADLASSAERLAQSAGAVLVTRGGRGGSIHRSGRPPVHLPALPVEAVDTTGAGDTVCGVFACAVAQGWGLERAFETALAAGSIATTGRGNVPAIPRRDEVLARSAGTVPVRVSAEEGGGDA